MGHFMEEIEWQKMLQIHVHKVCVSKDNIYELRCRI